MSGGQPARSSLNVIGWRHTVEYGSLEVAFILCDFAKPMIYTFFRPILGDSACSSEIVQAISAVRHSSAAGRA